MATVLLGKERKGDANLSASADGFTYTETHDYLVMSDDPNEDYWNVITTAGLPDVFVTSISGLLCRSKRATRDSGHAGLWRVSCEFSSEDTGQTPGGNPDPTTWIPVWSGAIELYDELLQKAKYASTATGTMLGPESYTNSAWDKFPEPLMIKKPIVVMEFSQYETPTLTVDAIAGRNDKINSAAFKGFSARSLKLNVRSFEKGFFFNYPAYKINYTVAYKPSLWVDAPLDVGYEYFVSATDDDRVSSPILVALNSDGTRKNSDQDPVVNWYYFPYEETSFASFIR